MFETVVRRIRDDNERAVCYHDVEEPQGRLITIVTTQRSDRMAIKENKVFLTEILNQHKRPTASRAPGNSLKRRQDTTTAQAPG